MTRLTFALLLLFPHLTFAQSIGFYNVENLFDTIHDAGKYDEEFTPSGAKEYGSISYFLSIRQSARVLRYMAENQNIRVIGLAEIENRSALLDLSNHRGFRTTGNWQLVHYDSPDRRGIDCAILYDAKHYTLRYSDRIRYSNDQLISRDAVFARFLSPDSLPFNLCVVHLPSKRGGASQSAWKRAYALQQVTQTLDTCQDPTLILGDFNESQAPLSNSVSLGNFSFAQPEEPHTQHETGTYKYKGRWSTIDLCLSNTSCSYSILRPEWLLENDTKWGGQKPTRRWQGTFFKNGYSDHLPVRYLNEFHSNK